MADKTAIHTVYKTADGKRVPGVTTYLGVLAKPALIHWAWQQGVAGLDYRKSKDQAADVGTIVHYLITSQLKGEEPDVSMYSPQDLATAAQPMAKFQDWLVNKKMEAVLQEVPLVSEKHRFGGTPDYYGWIDGVLTLLDFKTSKAIYQEYFYQIAAYKELLEENGYPVSNIRILRFGKNADEGFEERAVGNLDKHWAIFRACQEIYELQKEARKDG